MKWFRKGKVKNVHVHLGKFWNFLIKYFLTNSTKIRLIIISLTFNMKNTNIVWTTTLSSYFHLPFVNYSFSFSPPPPDYRIIPLWRQTWNISNIVYLHIHPVCESTKTHSIYRLKAISPRSLRVKLKFNSQGGKKIISFKILLSTTTTYSTFTYFTLHSIKEFNLSFLKLRLIALTLKCIYGA